MVEYIIAIDVTRVRFPADAYVKRVVEFSAKTAVQSSLAIVVRDAREASNVFQRRYSQLCADGSIAQWLERLTADQQVPGSNPGWPFI